MNKSDIVTKILGKRLKNSPKSIPATAFSPSNIALCKYWGKRNKAINLPITSSLSISLGKKGTTTELKISDTQHDIIELNHRRLDLNTPFSKRLIEFLNLFRSPSSMWYLHISTQSNFPVAAGLASSASGFVAFVCALNAMAMHALMLSSCPSIIYFLPETIDLIKKILTLRQEGLPIYYTQDAGPNLKLIFLEKDKETIFHFFENMHLVQPFVEDKERRSSP
jgi:mevalonate pyrophosphate decarboxylase